MEPDDNKTPAEATPAPAAKPARKPRTPKAKAQPVEGAAEAATAPVKVRKPRAPKAQAQPAGPEGEAPAPAAAEAPAAKPAKARKPRTPKAAKAHQEAPVEASSPAANPVAEPAAAPQGEHVPQPRPQHEAREPREPRERELEPAPGFAAPETVGGNEGGNNGGRRNKRRRNKRRGNEGQPQPQPQQSPRIDPAELVRRAWKIYLGEVTEEGLALMDDRTAAEASRRAFRVAEIFLTEAARHQRPEPSAAPSAEAVEAAAAPETTPDGGADVESEA